MKKGWFVKKYDNVAPKLPIDEFDYILRKFGEKAARETLMDVQEGRISVKTLKKYLYK